MKGTEPAEVIPQLYQYTDCETLCHEEVCNDIERKFNITIKFANPSIGEKTITGLLDASNLKSVLSSISLLSQHEFKFDGDTYTML